SRRAPPEARYDLFGEEPERAERLLLGEIAPGEAADDVVRARRLDQARNLIAHPLGRAHQDRLVAERRVQVHALRIGRVTGIVPELDEARGPARMSRPGDRLRFLVRVRDDDLPVDADARGRDVRIEPRRVAAMLRPGGAIALDEAPVRLRRAEPDQMHV